jgi:hypothetical protein
MENLTKEDIKYLVIGIRLQVDEAETQVRTNYDINIRTIYENKIKILYDLWGKLEKVEQDLNK